MLMSQIHAASLQARKSQDTERATLLVTLYAEVQKVGKDAGNRDTTDDEAARVVRKFLKGIAEFLGVAKEEAVRARLLREKSVLESFLPGQADAATLRAAVADIVAGLADASPKAMGAVMKALKERLGGNYDGALASQLVREALGRG